MVITKALRERMTNMSHVPMRCKACGKVDNECYMKHTESGTFCESCYKERTRSERRPSPYERTKSMVYATGNKWAIENWNSTH